MNIENLIPTLNFITENNLKKIHENDKKSGQVFKIMKENLHKRIKQQCESSYKYLIENKLYEQKINFTEDTLDDLDWVITIK